MDCLKLLKDKVVIVTGLHSSWHELLMARDAPAHECKSGPLPPPARRRELRHRGGHGPATSKAAVDHLTRNLALEFAAKGVRVNGVSPGLIVSEFQKRAGMPEDVYDKFLVSMAESYPLKRVGYPEDVAKAIIFLASDMSSFITGFSINVDGGSHLGMGIVQLPASSPSQTKTTAK